MNHNILTYTTMKKTYIQPSFEALNVNNEVFLAASTFTVNTTDNEYTTSDFAAKLDTDLSLDIEDAE